jgi:N-acyl-D-amino-acid deacylase
MACHHQPAALVVAGAMRDAGLPFDRAAADIQAKAVLTARSADVLQGIEFGGRHDSALYALDGSMAYASPANATTDMLVHYLSYTQNANGSWSSRGPVSSRPPAQDSDIQRTAHNAKLLLHYGWPARQAEFQRAAAKARQWLEQAEPVAQYEVSELLIGLVNVGSPKADAVARRLVSIQHSGGGWAQSQYLAPDAYATSLAMHALRLHGMKVSDPVYARGVKFLRESQLEDGSWYVASRSAKFQPYFQSGFPHEHDQWISILATAYAVRALAPVHAEE